MAPKVLVVLTSHGAIEAANNKPTGWFLPELSHPYDVLTRAGVEIVVASPKGGTAPLDPGSVEMSKDDDSAQQFARTMQHVWSNTLPISSFLGGRADEFAALFYPGGHGPMFDLLDDPDSLALIHEFAQRDKVVAAVCHGPIALVRAKGKDARLLLQGKEATGFSNAEEDQVDMTRYMPTLLEEEIKRAGATYRKADEPWGEMVVVQDGGKLITGQNPASAKGVGEAILKAIGL
ncbi:DJ-1/PfpI family protein [Xylariaceae sp. FL0594]|nr:DJ-1/PfpI family protein [Xylariaceae sp. FL0594]